MSPEEKQAMLMQVMGAHEAPAGPVQGNFQDPEAALLGVFQQRFNLSPDEVQQLQMAPPEEGLTLRQRLERLRPNTGGIEWGVDGEQITGRVEF